MADTNFRLRIGHIPGVPVAVLVERVVDGMWWDKSITGATSPDPVKSPILFNLGSGLTPQRNWLVVSTLPISPATTSFWMTNSQYVAWPYVWITSTNTLGGWLPGMFPFTLTNGSDIAVPVSISINGTIVSGP